MRYNFFFGFLFWATIAVAQDAAPAPPFVAQTPTYTTDKKVNGTVDLRERAATSVPPDLAAQAQAQFKVSALIAEKPEAKTLGANTAAVHFPGCDPKAAKFDWRASGTVSRVKDQGRCGDCFIFASTGAFEASWYLQNNERITVSEQQILDCSQAGSCNGGWHGNVFDYIKTHGIGSDREIPYTGRPTGRCDFPSKSYSAINWSYVDRLGSMAPPEKIKAALCSHGPVVSAVYASEDFLHYTGGVFNEFQEADGASSVNHDILIVGWDDSVQAWLIKNSWGENSWGENGFMRIRYRSNWIGYGAAWIDAIKIKKAIEEADLRSVANKTKILDSEAIKQAIDSLKKSVNLPNKTEQIDHLGKILGGIK